MKKNKMGKSTVEQTLKKLYHAQGTFNIPVSWQQDTMMQIQRMDVPVQVDELAGVEKAVWRLSWAMATFALFVLIVGREVILPPTDMFALSKSPASVILDKFH